MLPESFFNYRRLRYFKISLGLLAVLSIAYATHKAYPVPNGGTWLGYTLGIMSTLLIVWLMWFGIRKRHYKSSFGSLQGWLSAHIWLGLLLIAMVTLHSGFQIGWNVHSLAYFLMLAVIFSGMYGVFVYLYYPQKMAENQGGLTPDVMVREILALEQECLSLADGLSAELHQSLLETIESIPLGGSAWQQLTRTHYWSWLVRKRRAILQQVGVNIDENLYDPTIFLVAEKLAQTTELEENRQLRRLLELLTRKNALLARLRKNIQYQAFLDIWLYVHIPLSFALLSALIVHIITVFLYW
ncbi:MAG: hypothetical protein RIT27_2294 [Pseudomonadota bacterium]|jgi:hypothetical protein